VAARSKARACGLSLVEAAGSKPAGGMKVFRVCFLCCQVEVSATVRSLVQRSPTERGVCLSVIVRP
jgi:hypothetical protein